MPNSHKRQKRRWIRRSNRNYDVKLKNERRNSSGRSIGETARSIINTIASKLSSKTDEDNRKASIDNEKSFDDSNDTAQESNPQERSSLTITQDSKSECSNMR